MDFQEITQYERKLFNDGIKYVAGIDEVGRGPLAGPFVVSAVILDLKKIFSDDFQKAVENSLINKKTSLENAAIVTNRAVLNTNIMKENRDGVISRYNDALSGKDLENTYKLYGKIKDSKKLSSKMREILSEFIKKEAISYSIEVFGPEEVDKLGISELTQRAFFQAIKNLKVKPQYVLTDTFEVVKITKQNQKNIVNGDNKSISIASASIVAKVFRDSIMIKMHEKYPNYGFDKNKGYGTAVHLKALKEFGPCEIHRKSFEPIKSFEKNQ